MPYTVRLRAGIAGPVISPDQKTPETVALRVAVSTLWAHGIAAAHDENRRVRERDPAA